MYVEEKIADMEEQIKYLTEKVIQLEMHGANDFVTAEELAKIMKCTKNTIYLKVRGGEIDAVRIGNRVKIPLSQFYDKCKKSKIESKPKRNCKIKEKSVKDIVFGD